MEQYSLAVPRPCSIERYHYIPPSLRHDVSNDVHYDEVSSTTRSHNKSLQLLMRGRAAIAHQTHPQIILTLRDVATQCRELPTQPVNDMEEMAVAQDLSRSRGARPVGKRPFKRAWALSENHWVKRGIHTGVIVFGIESNASLIMVLRIRLPLPLGYKTFSLTINLSRLPFCGLMSYNISISNTIDPSSAIVEACRSGNVEAVRRLIASGKAGPNDMTPNRRPLSWVCIQR